MHVGGGARAINQHLDQRRAAALVVVERFRKDAICVGERAALEDGGPASGGVEARDGLPQLALGAQPHCAKLPDGSVVSSATAFSDLFIKRGGRWLIAVAFGVELPAH